MVLVKRMQKGREHYPSSQTNKTTFPYFFKAVEVLAVDSDFVKKLKVADDDALKQLVLFAKPHGSGHYYAQIALGGCRRFRKEKGFPTISEFDI